MVDLVMSFDYRTPAWAAPSYRLYAESLEMASFADRVGFTMVRVSEHHVTEDGYCPSPISAGAAIAGRTSRVRISLSALIVPLYHPLRLAEDIAVVDNISNGRIEVVFGAGYRRGEYEALGADFDGRADAMEEMIPVIRHALSGTPLNVRGSTVVLAPRPVQAPHPPLSMGGMSPSAARRAARLDLPFVPPKRKESVRLYEIYQGERLRLGLPSAAPMPPLGPGFIFVWEDPEEAWSLVLPHLLHEANTSARWLAESTSARPFRPETAESIRENPLYAIVTPDECVVLADRLGHGAPLLFQPLVAGLDPNVAWRSLELLETSVLPRIMPPPAISAGT